ncbi:MAG: discoidin domain-containing protein [Muribaculaceae bacterium]|nr:discoidin domain-containing protein [Muribaculaceae bacterium]
MLSKSLIAAIAVTVAFTANAGNDSIKVVKGQVSDYYIPVVTQYEVTGTVTDQYGRPLDGATVMWLYSPAHSNTDPQGHFSLIGTDTDVKLCVHYPGMEMITVTRESRAREVNIVMLPKHSASVAPPRRAAQATRWYDPQNPATSTYCNPLNISYNYEPWNNNTKNGGSFRSSADPMGLTYKGEYYLFSTNQGGFHYSHNLSDWNFTVASFQRHPADDDECAPAAWVVGDTLYYTGSTYEGLPIWYSTDPKNGRWRRAVERNTLPTWDPYVFLDDDGKLYEYYGSSNEYPVKGVQISRDDFTPISKIHDLVLLQPKQHGWERFGMNNDDEVTLKPFMEGAFMTKHNGKYYFQYGAPGTEFKIYADGVYVGDNPLGPFTYQQHNPMSYKPGGFVQGVGHGGTFADLKGNYWHVGTCMLSLKYKFERRIGIYPTAFDADGVMYCITAFGDYPCWNADSDIKNPAERFSGWMLLSYGKPCTVSSTDSTLVAASLTDENMRTYWSAASGGTDEWVQIDLEGERTVRAIQLNYYDHHTVQHNRANDIYYQYRILASNDGEHWTLVVDKSDNDRDVPHDYIELREPLNTRFLRVENLHMPSGGNFCLSELRVFGKAEGEIPSAVKKFTVKRDKKDPRNAMITWAAVEGAYGYNIYYGTAPQKMYHCITVNDDTEYDFRGLDLGTDYYFAIEALAETGRGPLSSLIKR